MKALFLLVVALGLVAFGCLGAQPGENETQNNGTGNATNTTGNGGPGTGNATIPPGYEVKDFCKADSDCVRLNRCCDCGLGEYVNKYNQQPECAPGEPRCMCPIALSKGVCQDNRCVAVAEEPAGDGGEPPSGFCGTSTGGSCSQDSDCTAGGCSDQVCQSKSEEPRITTCEYRDCYNAQAYGLSCGCASGKCRWK